MAKSDKGASTKRMFRTLAGPLHSTPLGHLCVIVVSNWTPGDLSDVLLCQNQVWHTQNRLHVSTHHPGPCGKPSWNARQFHYQCLSWWFLESAPKSVLSVPAWFVRHIGCRSVCRWANGVEKKTNQWGWKKKKEKKITLLFIPWY